MPSLPSCHGDSRRPTHAMSLSSGRMALRTCRSTAFRSSKPMLPLPSANTTDFSRSATFGNERFKPRQGQSTPLVVTIPNSNMVQVVRTPEEAAKTSKAPYDYVLLCVKALPDVYDIASIIESVVAPQHTCILINTTHSLGVESYLEQRFPTNVVLSLVAGAELSQVGASEFEHKGSADIWVGPANRNPSIPASIQSDMAEALAMTLSSGQVDCKVSSNIRQQQYERMIG